MAHRTPRQPQLVPGSIDLDRDWSGQLIPLHIRRSRTQRNLHERRGDNEAIDPFTTSAQPAQLQLKRKRGFWSVPPEAYVYVRSNDPAFNIFSNGFLLYPELCFALAACLPLRDLISLYAISRDFHTIIDSRFTTVCLTQALRKAPQSARIFRFRMFAQFCRPDPVARLPHPNPAMATALIPRSIPSLRWVGFVFHRERVVHEIMTLFAERGCPLPARCNLALMKLWILFDVPDNARRIGMMHNRRMFTDMDLYFLISFFVKLDLVLHNPVQAVVQDGFRNLILSHKMGLDLLLKVLKRELWRNQSDIIKAFMRITMNLEHHSQELLDSMGVKDVFGIPIRSIGIGKYEYWGLKGLHDPATGLKRHYLLRPDQLTLREAVRRNLDLRSHFRKSMLMGYVRPDTLENFGPRKYGRRQRGLLAEEYNINDATGGLRALSVEEGGDVLLDLGDTSRGSKYTIRREATGPQEAAMRQSQKNSLEKLYRVSREESHQQLRKEIVAYHAQ